MVPPLPRQRAGFGFVDEETPELTIAVVPSRRGGQQGHKAISRSAEQGMTKLYERYGFAAVEEKDGTVTMKADL